MYGRIPYLNNSLSFWTIHHSDLRRFLYYTGVCSGTPLSAPLQVHFNSLQQWLVLHTLLFQQEVFNKDLLGVSDDRHGLGVKVSTISLFQQMKCMGRKLHYTTLKVSFHHQWEVLSWGNRVDVMSSFSYWLMEEKWGSQSGSSHLQGFFRLVYTNLKSFRTSCDTQASLLSLFWETDLLLYTWCEGNQSGAL